MSQLLPPAVRRTFRYPHIYTRSTSIKEGSPFPLGVVVQFGFAICRLPCAVPVLSLISASMAIGLGVMNLWDDCRRSRLTTFIGQLASTVRRLQWPMDYL
ncbi:hypothetical protein SODALDRAFT_330862 [Sodiomyces alkalinus F11]|uniref:Uncharacterized protein n=1 Tax=Sodiomyces alkalinus (strain CBS 110278 / VKM F-3762 / F11) TaxID=1314773 RepID=A0A3N2Q301_SODAK|nr:hypothetical protein SODALDRAFT_330862 [Sodiomyces alkalinus F11]ROT41151.1 hypothetical protein SODALDRAFT_330862 [Sodiomyces alkalinus F11]